MLARWVDGAPYPSVGGNVVRCVDVIRDIINAPGEAESASVSAVSLHVEIVRTTGRWRVFDTRIKARTGIIIKRQRSTISAVMESQRWIAETNPVRIENVMLVRSQ